MNEELLNKIEDLSRELRAVTSSLNNADHSNNEVIQHLITASSENQNELLTSVLNCAMHTVDAEGAGLTLYDEEKGKLIFKAAVGIGSENIIGAEVPIEGSVHGMAFRSGQIQSQTPEFKDIEEKTDAVYKSVMVAPLIDDEDNIGTISVVNKQGQDYFNLTSKY